MRAVSPGTTRPHAVSDSEGRLGDSGLQKLHDVTVRVARVHDLGSGLERLGLTDEIHVVDESLVFGPEVVDRQTDVGGADVVVRDALVGVPRGTGVLERLYHEVARVEEDDVHVGAGNADEPGERLVVEREAVDDGQSQSLAVELLGRVDVRDGDAVVVRFVRHRRHLRGEAS